MAVKNMTKRSQRVIVKYGSVEYKHEGVWFEIPNRGSAMPFSASQVAEMRSQGFDFSSPGEIMVDDKAVSSIQLLPGANGALRLIVKN